MKMGSKILIKNKERNVKFTKEAQMYKTYAYVNWFSVQLYEVLVIFYSIHSIIFVYYAVQR